jgi:hypothetical protein
MQDLVCLELLLYNYEITTCFSIQHFRYIVDESLYNIYELDASIQLDVTFKVLIV